MEVVVSVVDLVVMIRPALHPCMFVFFCLFVCPLLRGPQYLSGTVVNALREQHGEFLLKELVRRWSNHKIMNQWMQKFFQYLDRWGHGVRVAIGRRKSTIYTTTAVHVIGHTYE